MKSRKISIYRILCRELGCCAPMVVRVFRDLLRADR